MTVMSKSSVMDMGCATTTGTVTVSQAGPLLSAILKAMEGVLTVDLPIMTKTTH